MVKAADAPEGPRRSVARWLPAAVAAWVVVLFAAPGFFPGTPAGPAATPSPSTALGVHSTPAAAAPGPGGTHVGPTGIPTSTGSFFGNNSSFADQSVVDQVCTKQNSGTFHYRYCYPQATNPSVLQLANGNSAVGYSIYTTVSSTACAGAKVNTLSRVAFSTST